MDHRRLWRPVVHRDPHQDVLRRGLGVFDQHVEVTIVVEHAGIDQLELGLVLAAPPVLRDQPAVGELGLRIFVEILQIAVGRRGIEVIIELLDVLAVIALAVGQAEQPLLEDRVLAVPERQRQAQPLSVVADPGDAVLAPAVGARAGLVVGEVLPGVAIGAVILAHGAPLALAEIGPPALPAHITARVLRKPRALGGLGRGAWRGPRLGLGRSVEGLQHARASTGCVDPGRVAQAASMPRQGVAVCGARSSTRRLARSSSPSDQAWNGQPPGR